MWCAALFAGIGLLATGCAWGVVTDAETGAPVEGASVMYVDSAGAVNTKLTGPGGLYRFDAVEGDRIPARGRTLFIVVAPGYQALMVQRDLEYDDNDVGTWEIQSFELARVPAPSPTATSSSSPVPTDTATASPTPTAAPTSSATPSATLTPTPIATATATIMPTATPTPP